MDIKLEVCCENISAVLNAKKAKAYRVELCKNLSVGGLTPFREDILKARSIEGIKLNVLIRPHDGNFIYNKEEIEQMQEDIRFCGENKCDGVVIGALTSENAINKEQTIELIDAARNYSMSITFHRAFDESSNLLDSMEDCISLGCDRILTSGGHKSAYDGRHELKELIRKADGRIIVMPGAGVTPENIKEIAYYTQCSEIHGSFQGSKEKMIQAVKTISSL